MTYKYVIGKDGKYSTEQGPVATDVQRSLEQTRKELKDMIAGNTQFHNDPLATPQETPKSEPVVLTPEQEELWDAYGQWGMFP